MVEKGFVKLYRSILMWEWYADTEMVRLYLHLLLTVNIEERYFRGFLIKPGTRVCSYNTLAYETGMSQSQIRRTINKMKQRGIIEYNVYSEFAVVTLCEPEKYTTENSMENSTEFSTEFSTG